MASVYRARDLRLNREVAVKILREDLTRDPEFLIRFEREAQYVASLSHPHIVPVYDVGEESGARFIVMEYVKGRTLKDALEGGGPLPVPRAMAIMDSVLDALRYAHGKGLVHRDIKPHNILLSADGTARLADFGIAHLVDGSTTRTAAILGSAHYLSPEQSRGDEATPVSDLYAAGIVLFEMLSGAPPFDGPNALAIAHHHIHTSPPSLPQSVQREAPGLEGVVRTALAKDPGDRFQDADSFADALRHASPQNEATQALPMPRDDTTTALVPVRPAPVRRAENRAPVDDGITLRRSTRKTAAAGTLLTGTLAAAAYGAAHPLMGHSLPNYPSAPYAALPAGLFAVLAAMWINVRSWIYRMDGNAAVVQWGLLSHHRFGVPVRNITTLELKQSPIDRLLGVGTLELCARDQQGEERHLIMEDLPHPREVYEDLARLLGRAGRRGRLEEE